MNAHPEAIEIGGDLEDHVPWTLIPDLDPTVRDDICFRRTSFSGMCGEVSLDATSVPEFLKRAVEFLNNTVWGTLSNTMVVSEQSLSDPLIAAAMVRTIADLHYGTVALNGPGTWGFYTIIAPWGGYPGSSLQDIQSGTCRATNFLMLHVHRRQLCVHHSGCGPTHFSAQRRICIFSAESWRSSKLIRAFRSCQAYFRAGFEVELRGIYCG